MKKIFFLAGLIAGLVEANGQNVSMERLSRPETKVDADSALIVFEADDLYGTGMIGYQLLLDADHDAYGRLFDPSQETFLQTQYNGFEYRIPENASPSDNTSVVLAGKDSIMIPAGIYDYVILSPRPGGLVFYMGGEHSFYDDFHFAGGHTYRLHVTNVEYISTTLLYADTDIAAEGLQLPANSTELTENESITMDIINRGDKTVSNFPVYFSINGKTPVSEIVPSEIAPGDTLSYLFSSPADMSAEGLIQVKAWTGLQGDALSFNDTVEGECMHIGIASLPYAYSFSSATDFAWDWTRINANKDWLEWSINDYLNGADGKVGFASCAARTAESNDWIISNPIAFGSGKHHLCFYMYNNPLTVPNQTAGTAKIEVFYGQSMDTASLHSLGVYEATDEAWIEKGINFNVAEAGNYHIAFKAISEPACELYLDEVTVDTGNYVSAPAIELRDILLPVTNCNLSDATPVGISVANVGNGAAMNVKIRYAVNGNAYVEETYAYAIPAGGHADIYFEEPADFSKIGEYEITAIAEAAGSSDTLTEKIAHRSIISEYPAYTHFSLNEDIDSIWTPLSEGSWVYEEMGAWYSTNSIGTDNGLLSRCFHMEGQYRVELAYTGGGMGYPASFCVLFGEAGTDMASWDTVYSASGILSVNIAEFELSAPEISEYNLMVVNMTENPRAPFRLLDFGLFRKMEHDMALEQVVSPLARYMPSNQLGGEMRYDAVVRNLGIEPLQDVRLAVIFKGDTLFRSKEGIRLDSATNATISASGILPAMKPGEEFSLSLAAYASEQDGFMENNMHDLPATHVTDTLYAMENVSNMDQGIGQTGSAFNFGNVYTLTATDTLTSITYALKANELAETQDIAIGLAVFHVAENGIMVDKKIFSTTFNRPSQAGLYTETLPAPRVLEPGRYYFEFQQLTADNAGVLYQEDTDGICYNRSGDSLIAMNYGINVAIRANFAPNAHVYEKDIAVVGFTRPVHDSALFSNAETIGVVLENNGTDSVVNIEVNCVTGSQQKTLTISMDSYEKKEFLFEGFDLYAAGSYDITVSANLEGDENTENNSLSHTWFCHSLTNPAYLDFELANDFDTAVFNRGWTSFDLVGERTDAFWQFVWPGRFQPVGFMAFNISSTTPAMTSDLNVPGFEAYEGKRFGVAFAPVAPGVEANTWLISPAVQLGEKPGFEFYVSSLPGYNEGSYQLWVSDKSSHIEDFVMLGQEQSAPAEWTKVSESLEAYAGKTVYVALQYLGGENSVCMMVDNLRVITDGMANESLQEIADVQLYQNMGKVFVRSDRSIKEINVYNMSGACLQRLPSSINGTSEFSIEGWASGLYLCQILLENGELVCLKFIKQ